MNCRNTNNVSVKRLKVCNPRIYQASPTTPTSDDEEAEAEAEEEVKQKL
jgi:division protein CdvB (Snf7/Vps24/ESCRT-III family)